MLRPGVPTDVRVNLELALDWSLASIFPEALMIIPMEGR